MWFKNLQIYRLPQDWAVDLQRLDEHLAQHPLQGCNGLDLQSTGWISPRDDGRFVHSLNKQLLLALGVEQKLLPASIVNQFAKDKAKEIDENEGRRVGRKEMREIKERVTEELLPRAFARRRTSHAWIDPVNGWLVIDAAALGKAEELLEQLHKAIDAFPARQVRTQRSPGAAMTGWVAGGEAPAGFTLDQDLELRSPDEAKATVRYVRHPLEGDEIRGHIAAGKTATRLGMTWNDRISFVLTDELQIKRVTFLDVLKEEAEGQAENDDERFDVDFALMTGELAQLLADLLAALGGEVPPAP